jgi:ketosteroid isomerase-like protein
MSAPGPRELFERLIEGITSGNYHELHHLYAEDAVVEHPFEVPDPTRWVGIEDIREHFASGARRPLELTTSDVRVHQTEDPEVIVAEYEYHGTVTTTGERFTVGNILVIRARDGRITYSRNYHNHTIMGTAQGRLPAMTAALAKAYPAATSPSTVD